MSQPRLAVQVWRWLWTTGKEDKGIFFGVCFVFTVEKVAHLSCCALPALPGSRKTGLGSTLTRKDLVVFEGRLARPRTAARVVRWQSMGLEIEVLERVLHFCFVPFSPLVLYHSHISKGRMTLGCSELNTSIAGNDYAPRRSCILQSKQAMIWL